MEKRTVTVMVMSDRKGTTRRFVFSSSLLKTFAVVFLMLSVVGAATVVDYVGLLVQSQESKRLKAENIQLRTQFQVVEDKVNNLEKTLERIRGFASKLRMITNLNEDGREMKLAIGPLPRVGQSVNEFDIPMDRRGPASELEKQDKVFFEKAPLDLQDGELAYETNRDYASLSVRVEKVLGESSLREQDVLSLWESLADRQSLLRSTPSLKPVNGWLTSNFGYRISPFSGRPVMHKGLDIAASPGTAIYAPADGVVIYGGYDSGYGKLLSIDHGYGVVTRYGHISKISVGVGQKVKRGDLVAAVGNTGRSTGPHLHYEVRINNQPVDPANYVLDEE